MVTGILVRPEDGVPLVGSNMYYLYYYGVISIHYNLTSDILSTGDERVRKEDLGKKEN